MGSFWEGLSCRWRTPYLLLGQAARRTLTGSVEEGATLRAQVQNDYSACTRRAVRCSVTRSCLTLCNPKDCGLPGSSSYGIFQARILEWVAISFSKGSSQIVPASLASPALAGGFFTPEPPGSLCRGKFRQPCYPSHHCTGFVTANDPKRNRLGQAQS